VAEDEFVVCLVVAVLPVFAEELLGAGGQFDQAARAARFRGGESAFDECFAYLQSSFEQLDVFPPQREQFAAAERRLSGSAALAQGLLR
jgi:hypothetical protein